VKRRVRKLQGGGMDASKSDFKSPNPKGSDHSHSRFDVGSGYYGEKKTTTGGGGGGGKPPGPNNTGTKDVPFKAPVPTIGPLTALFNFGAHQNYKARQKFARKEGLYRDYYKVNQKVLKPNSPEGKAYLKDAGFGKTKFQTADGGGVRCPDGSLPPCPPAKPSRVATPTVPQPFKPYFMGFDFQKKPGSSSFKRGGLSGGKRFGPPPKKGPNPHGTCPHRKDGIRGVGAVERGRGVKFVGVK
jgi:hypothetical protein